MLNDLVDNNGNILELKKNADFFIENIISRKSMNI